MQKTPHVETLLPVYTSVFTVAIRATLRILNVWKQPFNIVLNAEIFYSAYFERLVD